MQGTELESASQKSNLCHIHYTTTSNEQYLVRTRLYCAFSLAPRAVDMVATPVVQDR